MDDLTEMLRPKRKALVLAAEEAVKALLGGTGKEKLKKSQLNHLIGVCGEASCSEEIENYLRYQAGRDNTGWTPERAKAVIAGVSPVLEELEKELEGNDRARVTAFRLYAVFLTRAFTYEARARDQRSPAAGAGGPAPAPQQGRRR